MATKSQVKVYVRLQAICSHITYAQRELQLVSARLLYVSRLASDDKQEVSRQDIMYFTRRRDLMYDRYMAARGRLHAVLIVIAGLFEANRHVQTQCLKLIYCAYPTMYEPVDDETLDLWIESVGGRVNTEISQGIVADIDELNRLLHDAVQSDE